MSNALTSSMPFVASGLEISGGGQQGRAKVAAKNSSSEIGGEAFAAALAATPDGNGKEAVTAGGAGQGETGAGLVQGALGGDVPAAGGAAVMAVMMAGLLSTPPAGPVDADTVVANTGGDLAWAGLGAVTGAVRADQGQQTDGLLVGADGDPAAGDVAVAEPEGSRRDPAFTEGGDLKGSAAGPGRTGILEAQAGAVKSEATVSPAQPQPMSAERQAGEEIARRPIAPATVEPGPVHPGSGADQGAGEDLRVVEKGQPAVERRGLVPEAASKSGDQVTQNQPVPDGPVSSPDDGEMVRPPRVAGEGTVKPEATVARGEQVVPGSKPVIAAQGEPASAQVGSGEAGQSAAKHRPQGAGQDTAIPAMTASVVRAAAGATVSRADGAPEGAVQSPAEGEEVPGVPLPGPVPEAKRGASSGGAKGAASKTGIVDAQQLRGKDDGAPQAGLNGGAEKAAAAALRPAMAEAPEGVPQAATGLMVEGEVFVATPSLEPAAGRPREAFHMAMQAETAGRAERGGEGKPAGDAHLLEGAPRKWVSDAVGRQLVARVAKLSPGDGEVITIDLRPPEMGRLELRLAFKDGSVTAVAMGVERPETFEALKAARGQIESRLADAGINLGSGGLGLHQGRVPQEAREDGGADAKSRGNGSSGGVTATAGAAEAGEIEAGRRPAAGRLVDLIV